MGSGASLLLPSRERSKLGTVVWGKRTYPIGVDHFPARAEPYFVSYTLIGWKYCITLVQDSIEPAIPPLPESCSCRNLLYYTGLHINNVELIGTVRPTRAKTLA